MTEKTELKMASNESVALELTLNIAQQEELYNDPSTYRKKLLDLYSECLCAANGYREI